MRVAMIGQKGIPATMGGIERHVEELSTRLSSRGVDVVAYARPWYVRRPSWSRYAVRGVTTIVVPSLHTKHGDAISHTVWSTLHAIVRVRPDIYHFHGVGPALAAWIPRIFAPRSRVIVTFHCVDRRHAKWGWFARAALAAGEWAACRFPHETVTVGRTLAAYCRERFRCDSACIPNGVAMPRSAPSGDADILRAFDLVPRRYLLVVSRLIPHKGIHLVISAFRGILREQSARAGLTLAVVGAPSFTDTYAGALVSEHGREPGVRFLGEQHGAALDALYRNCLCFVHASTSEGLPTVVLEATAAGAVPLVSDIPEHCEVIERIGGMTFRSGDARDLQVKLEALVASADALPAIGVDIRRRALRAFSWDDATERTIERYRNVCPEHSEGPHSSVEKSAVQPVSVRV